MDPAISRIADLVRAQRYAEAREAGIDWLKANPSSPSYDRGLLVTAEAMRGTREYVKAFYYCDQLLDERADSPLFEPAMQLQYELADAYLLGAKDRFVGLRIVGRQDEAVEMLFRIQQRAPGSPVAEKALLRTADYYWAIGDFDLASDAYHSYVQSYPRSPLVPQARLREAYSNLAQFHGPNFDSTPVLNAKTLLRQIEAEYPELAKQEAVAEKLELADRQMARKLYLNADFYRRTRKPGAALVICRRLLKQYPNTPEAADAEAMIARLERNPS
jgi:outer membrane assembly lipoprotein YfiO